ncbi:hypothetical protein [Granulicoccus phenolivorans]|uniref:hypothetical protein n=1 Tax=Granulicoccus phenolivorans TaxID=266854 RepID=UPI000406284F|nr:hypothetical protein [Granulicoccus phenolivorans]
MSYQQPYNPAEPGGYGQGDPYAPQDPYAQPYPTQDPYAQPYQAQDPYAQQVTPYVAGAYGQQPEHPQSQTVLILGIVGIFTGVCAFVAWYMGGQAKKEIEAGAPYQWGGNLKTGYLLGKVFSIITIVVVVLYVLIYAIIFAAILAS